jgi:hypothetical protein
MVRRVAFGHDRGGRFLFLKLVKCQLLVVPVHGRFDPILTGGVKPNLNGILPNGKFNVTAGVLHVDRPVADGGFDPVRPSGRDSPVSLLAPRIHRKTTLLFVHHEPDRPCSPVFQYSGPGTIAVG